MRACLSSVEVAAIELARLGAHVVLVGRSAQKCAATQQRIRSVTGAESVEFLVADNGIGHLIWNSWTTLSISQSVAGLVTAGIIGSTLFAIAGAIEKRVIPWAPENR